MIRIWLARDNTIPIREQLSSQLLLGILSRHIAPGERMPSIRDLARHLKVHANTVSAAYRDLAARGWVTNRKGSGVYVRASMPEPAGNVETFVRTFLEDARARGFSPDEIATTLQRLRNSPAHKFVVVHPDRDLAAILAAEIEEALNTPIPFATPADAALTPETCVLTTATTADRIIAELHPAATEVIPLNSMEAVIAGQSRRATPPLVAVVSRSLSIRQWASPLICALGFSDTDVLFRDPAQSNWRRGLAACDIVAADVLASRELLPRITPTEVRIVDSGFLAKLAAGVSPFTHHTQPAKIV